MSAPGRRSLALPKPDIALAVLGLESGFETQDVAVISEQDILGDRLVRPRKASRRAENFIAEATSLAAGDLVVHVDHGIGRFVGLKTIEAAGAPHDCLEIHYAGGDKLFLPVENIELLSRYGAEETQVDLDRLGGSGWQARKARMKSRIREIAHELLKVAAERLLRAAPKLSVASGSFDEFCAGFPYEETEDQQAAIDAVVGDLEAGRPMDRLICGDVGFGKTEVALRAAFIAAMNGKQVAVVVPTTLLARQHFKTFTERFRGFPVEDRAGLAARVGRPIWPRPRRRWPTARSISWSARTRCSARASSSRISACWWWTRSSISASPTRRSSKQLRAEVHVLTLTATPIPRTLQLALTGVRDLSIIASPPVDRLAVRTFVSPFDGLVVREALLRERYRGGQAFYVCPRIEDLAGAKDFLDKSVPEVRVAVAHGQMPSGTLEDIMTAFYDGKYDVLLSTTIIESGLDIPTANTLIVHRADRFGLSQLYQLRGRVGRAKLRAYALFTLPTRKITAQAEQRLKVLQSLDTLGAGFQLASHDLDIRGAGNLLGDEQSGHIKEVGFELYQQMLEEAVESLKAGIADPVADRWSPQITIGTPVLIPGRLRRRSVGAAVALSPPGRTRRRARDRGVRRGAGRPLRQDADRGRASAQDRRDQVALPARQCREDRYRAEGRGAVVPRQHVHQSGRPDRLHPRPGHCRARAAGHEGRVLRGLGAAGRAA